MWAAYGRIRKINRAMAVDEGQPSLTHLNTFSKVCSNRKSCRGFQFTRCRQSDFRTPPSDLIQCFWRIVLVHLMIAQWLFLLTDMPIVLTCKLQSHTSVRQMCAALIHFSREPNILASHGPLTRCSLFFPIVPFAQDIQDHCSVSQ